MRQRTRFQCRCPLKLSLKLSDAADSDGIEERREENCQDCCCGGRDILERHPDDDPCERKDSRRNRRQLRAPSEGCHEEKRPTREGQPEEQVNPNEDADTGATVELDFPYDGNDDPRR